MIEGFSLGTAHFFNDALASQARLRHRVFVERRSLPHDTYGGLEYDAFDTPAAVYLVWRDAGLVVRGLIRLLPTTRPYMLQTFWPELVEDGRLPAAPDVWEITRVCVDQTVPSAMRRRIMPELLCAVAEHFERNGVSAMVGVTRPHLVDTYIREGAEWLGGPAEVEGELERAFRVPTEFIRPKAHLERLGIVGPTLRMVELAQARLAA